MFFCHKIVNIYNTFGYLVFFILIYTRKILTFSCTKEIVSPKHIKLKITHRISLTFANFRKQIYNFKLFKVCISRASYLQLMSVDFAETAIWWNIMIIIIFIKNKSFIFLFLYYVLRYVISKTIVIFVIWLNILIWKMLGILFM